MIKKYHMIRTLMWKFNIIFKHRNRMILMFKLENILYLYLVMVKFMIYLYLMFK